MTSKDKPSLSLTNPLLVSCLTATTTTTASPKLGAGLTLMVAPSAVKTTTSLKGNCLKSNTASISQAFSKASHLKSTVIGTTPLSRPALTGSSTSHTQATTLKSSLLSSSASTSIKPSQAPSLLPTFTKQDAKAGLSTTVAKKDKDAPAVSPTKMSPRETVPLSSSLKPKGVKPTGLRSSVPISKSSTQQPLSSAPLSNSLLLKPKNAKPTGLLSTVSSPKGNTQQPLSGSHLLTSTLTSSKSSSLQVTKMKPEGSAVKPSRFPGSQTTPVAMTVPVAKELDAAPSYNLSLEVPEESQEPEFLLPELDESVQKMHAPVVDIVGLKTALINTVATSLLSSPDFHNQKDPAFINLCAMGEKISRYDAEFVMKLALYTRCDLNIRTTANFLLALASNIHTCRPYLKKYFSTTVCLPSDWIEVAEIYTVFHDDTLNFGALPTALRKVMAAKFTEFDAYQLGKYNKESSKKKHKKKEKAKTKEEKPGKKGTAGAPDTKEKPGKKGTAGAPDTKATGKPTKGRQKQSANPQALTATVKGPKSKPPPPSAPDTEPDTVDEGRPSRTTTGDGTESDSDSSVVKDEQSESEEELKRLSFTLKQLVRKIHIFEPVEHVMCLIGKRYPEDPEAFRRSRLPGMWDQDRAGKRMKLATPETWETQVSLKGNVAATWEGLIDHSKLPFMAMLRNLRNLILANISPKHHQWVIRKLNDERAVVNSKQFPFRFFSAYEVLDGLEKIAKGEAPQTKQKKPGGKPKKGKPKKAKKPKELPKIDPKIVEKYKSALDSALKIATCYNVKPIAGSTIIICNVGSNMNRPCTTAKGLGKPRTVLEVGVLLGLMCKHACEHCSMLIYGESDYQEVELKEGTILHNMEGVLATATSCGLNSKDGKLPASYLKNMLVDRLTVDNLVLLTDTMKLDDEQGGAMLDFLNKYRQLVNPNLLFVSVDLSGRSSGISSAIKPRHENDIHLAGYSDQILRFIAERGDSGQITYVENIDKAYELKAVNSPAILETEPVELPSLGPETALLAAGQQKKWRTVRVFISSTFRDMHGERDLMTRFVFPELRARAHTRNIHVYEVDLRWGVTESDARSHKALEICLDEISRCQYFIGLLGQRYGWVQDEYLCPDAPKYDWLREYPAGRSITEVEMHHAALCNPDKVFAKAFFYFRHPSVVQTIPQAHRADFESESHESTRKIEDLKSRIRTTGLEVYDGYPSRWMGEVEGKPMVGGLEDFGMRVLHNIWNAIQRDFPDDEVGQDAVAQATAMHEAYAENQSANFVGRKTVIKQAQTIVEEGKSRLVLAVGKPGSGKSAFMAAFAQQYSHSDHCKSPKLVLSHFIGAAPGSGNILKLLSRLCHEMKRRFGLPLEVPTDYPDVVKAWQSFLEESRSSIGAEHTLLILIDGIDLLEDAYNAKAMDWLPQTIPDGVVIMLSAAENAACHNTLNRHKPEPTVVTIGSMDMWDKGEMVRQKLVKHRKVLDESAFNNQLKLLLTKKDAGNPLFLHLACEELRMFGVFEEVTEHLKQMPTTTPMLLQEVLKRLEGELGTELLSTCLSLLCLVRNGLLEFELAAILSMLFNKNAVKAVLPPMVVTRLIRSLQGFLQPTGNESSDRLCLAHKDIEKAVRLRYMQGAASDRERQLHQLLARYFREEADPTGDGQYKSNNGRAFNELPYHLMTAGLWSELEVVVTNLCFVVSKCRLGLAQELLGDYTPSALNLPTGKVKEVARFVQQPRVLLFKSFVSRSLHVVVANPTLALQQAVNEPSSSVVSKEAERLAQECRAPLLRWVNKLSEASPCRMTILHGGVITCVATSQDGKMLATGSTNCFVKLYEVETGRELRTFIGHAATITCVCFVGQNALCSASHDSTLCLWNIQDGYRVATLKGHQRSVRGCAANPSGSVICSVSWDTTIRVWNGSDGKCVSTLKTPGQRNTPLNCVAFHPEGQIVVIGSWDATLKVWDTYNQKKLKTLKGHKTSIQACAYAPSGRHIVSAALDGEVKIWSTKSDTAVGTVVGHHDPVNSVAFTPNGQYLLTASSDKLLKVWSGTLGQPVASFGKADHGFAHCMCYDASTQTVRVGYHDGHVRTFNVQTRAAVSASKIHNAAVVAVGYRDKATMSASVDGSIKIWASNSLPKTINLVGHTAAISCATWDAKGLASASEDLTILIWPHEARAYSKQSRAATKKGKGSSTADEYNQVVPLATLHGHTGKISSIAFSTDGLRMVSASHDKSLIIWDLISYTQIQQMLACHKDWINTCVFSDNSPDILVTGSNDMTLKLWDLKAGVEKITFKGHMTAINSVAFSQGCVVSGAFDGSLKVWTHKGIEITTVYCHQQRINACIVDIPGKQTSSSSDWADASEDAESSSSSETKQQIKLGDVRVFTASDDGTVGVWHPLVPNEVLPLLGHSDRVLSVAAMANNNIVSSSLDGTVKIWAPRLPSEQDKSSSLGPAVKGHIGPISSCSVSKDGIRIITAGRDGTCVLWALKTNANDTEGLTLDRIYSVKVSDKALNSVCYLDNSGEKAAIGGDDGNVSFYSFPVDDYASLDQVIASGMLMGDFPVQKLAVTPNREFVAAGSWSSKIASIQATPTKKGSNRAVVSTMELHKDWVMDLITAEEGQNTVVYSVGLDSCLYCWTLTAAANQKGPTQNTSATKYNISLPDEGRRKAWPLALCSVGHFLAIGDSNGRVTLWNTETKQIELTKKLHPKAINALATIGDSLATGSDDATVKIWKLVLNPTGLRQVGHFYTQSCVTAMTSRCGSKTNQEPMLIIGDSLGQLTLLQWKR